MSEGLLSGVHKSVMPNGLTLLVREDFTTPLVCLNFWVKVGSNSETDAVWGWSHGIEHMLFKGTSTRKAGDIAREVRTLGGTLNAATGYETTNYHITLPVEGFESALEIHADVLQNPAFDPGELERERGVLLEELRMYRDVPDGFGLTWDELMRVAFTRHRFGRSVVGTEATLAGTSRDVILEYFRRGYVPENIIYVVAGAVETDRAQERLAARLGGLPGRPVRLDVSPPEPPQEAFRYVALSGDIEQAYLKIGFHAPPERDPDMPALHVLTHLLGVGRSSRLHQRVLEKQGLVSAIGVMEESGRDPGILVVDAVTDPEKVEPAIIAIFEEIVRFHHEPIGERDLRKALNNVRAEYLQSLETVRGQAAVLGGFEALGDYRYAERYPDLIASITAADVTRVARKYLSFDVSTVLTYAPGEKSGPDRSDEARMRDRLRVRLPALSASAETPPPAVSAKETPAAPPAASRPRAMAAPHRPGDVVVRALPNGSRLILRPRPKLPLVALSAYGRAGVRFEPPQRGGLGTLTARCLVKGTESMGYEVLSDAIDHLGITLVPFADRDTCGFYLEAMTEHLNEALDLFAEMLIRPSFPEDAIERERQLQLAHIAQEQDDTLTHTLNTFFERLFGSHPYGRNPLGTDETVRAITRADLFDWHRRFFVPENLFYAAAGDFDPDVLTAEIARRLERLPSGAKPEPPAQPPPSIEKTTRQWIRREKEQSVIVLGMPAPSIHSDDRLPLEVLNRVLSGMGARLWDELREKRHLGYMVGSFYSAMDDAGLFAAYMGTSPDRVPEAVTALETELARALSEPPTDEELRRSINSLCGAHLIALQTNGGQAAGFARCEALGLGYERILTFPERIRSVTAGDVMRVSRDVLTLGRHVVIVLSPESADGVAGFD